LTVNAERTDVAINQMGKSRGFGIVVVSTATEAQRVIDSLKGYSFQGRSLEVREDRNAPAGPGSGTSFAGNARSGSINGECLFL
jgi:RNA recognition motif-containing protein